MFILINGYIYYNKNIIIMDRFSLKNVKFYEALSEETNCMHGTVYFDGKLLGEFQNDGHGGSTNVPYVRNQEVLDYLKTLTLTYPVNPAIKNDKPLTVKSNLENVVDMLFEKWLEEYYQKKNIETVKRKQVNHLVMENSFKDLATIKLGPSVESWIQGNPTRLKEIISKHKSEGWKILNTNLPEEFTK